MGNEKKIYTIHFKKKFSRKEGTDRDTIITIDPENNILIIHRFGITKHFPIKKYQFDGDNAEYDKVYIFIGEIDDPYKLGNRKKLCMLSFNVENFVLTFSIVETSKNIEENILEVHVDGKKTETIYKLHTTNETSIRDIKSFIKIAEKIYNTIN